MMTKRPPQDSSVEFIEVCNDDFYTGLVELGKGILVDCRQIVKTVQEISSFDYTSFSEDQESKNREARVANLKEVVESSASRATQMLNELTATIANFIQHNKELYADDPDYVALFKILLVSSKSVKEPVQHLVHFARVSFWRTRSLTTTMKAQELLETYYKKVALSIKKVIDAADELKLMEEDEEQGWIEDQVEELTKQIKNKTLTLVRTASNSVKDVMESSGLSKTQEDTFVAHAKEALTCLHELLTFCGHLGLKEEDELRISFRNFLQTAKNVFQGTARQTDLKATSDAVANVMRSVVLSASTINAEAIVMARIQENDNGPSAPPAALKSSGSSLATGNHRLQPTTSNNTPHLDKTKVAQDQQINNLIQLYNIRQAQKEGGKTGKVRMRATTRHETNVQAIDLKRFEKDLPKVVFAQRCIRSWLRVKRLRTLALDFLISPESDKLRKRNMALWEIIDTENTYVERLQDLVNTVITPLRSTSHAFITEEEINSLFSNIETIQFLNLEILERMESRMKKWPEECRFADIFIQKAPVLRVYSLYSTTYDHQMQVLTELEKRPAFVSFIKSQKSKISLGNYLILPVQRLPRYQILLDALLKYTPSEHVDYNNIIAALEEICKLNVHVDNKKKVEDNKKALKAIKKSVTNIGTLTLVAPQRVVVREGPLEVTLPGTKKKEAKMYIYLFNDMLLVTQMRGKAKQLPTPGDRPRTKLKDVVRFRNQCSLFNATEPASFKLSAEGGKKVYHFFGQTETGTERWVKDLTAVLNDQAWNQMDEGA